MQLLLNVEGPSSYSNFHSLCSHDIVSSQRAMCIENSPLNLKYAWLLARVAQRFPCYYARIMLDAFALLLFQKIFRHNYRKPTAIDLDLSVDVIKQRLYKHLNEQFKEKFISVLPCTFHLICPCARCSHQPHSPTFKL